MTRPIMAMFDLLGFAALAFTLTFGFFEWQETKAAGSVSATGLIAGLLTFALGAYRAGKCSRRRSRLQSPRRWCWPSAKRSIAFCSA